MSSGRVRIDDELSLHHETSGRGETTVLLNATARFHDYREDLIALNGCVPLLYVVREEMGPRVSRWAARHTPSARVEAFGGHMMFWERAEEFNRVLADFLEGCPG